MGRGKPLGAIVEIPLPNGLNSYARVYATDLNKLKTVSKIPFRDDEDIWGPDKVVVDGITLKGSLYHHGEIIPCTYEECMDLEVCAAWHINHLVDMLMGDDKWDNSIRRPKDI